MSGFNITVSHNAHAVAAFYREQPAVQRAIAVETLSVLAKESKAEQERKMPSDLDRPTRFTINSMVAYRAKAAKLESGVFVKYNQAEYLSRLVNSGLTIRRPKTRAIFIPAPTQKTNRYGNMPRARRKAALSGPTIKFKGKGAGSARVYRRVGRRLERLGTYALQTRYRGRYWKFYERALVHAGREFGRIWAREWDRRIR